MDEMKASKIKEMKLSSMAASVNYEFVRRCSHSEAILGKLAEDLISRYSSKQQPHPEFFQQDTALALNQLTLYTDEYVETMGQFQFLSAPAAIIANLSAATLRINDFLAAKLYQSMKIEAPAVPSLALAPVNLCSGCGKLRENERIRSMCNELRVGSDWNQTKVRRDVVPRNGEKYDVTQLLEEELESLDSLNEEEIRKRLISMELDHDRRRNDIEVCIDELKKASDRVAGYIAGGKKGKDLESSGKFNVEDYVFQLGRHFSHNLSSIDHKLRQFKENLSPLEDSQTQTEEPPTILLTDHQALIDQLTDQINSKDAALKEHRTCLLIEQRKYKEKSEIYAFLEDKLRQEQMATEQERLKRTVAETQFNLSLEVIQAKTAELECVVRKFKAGAEQARVLTRSISIQHGPPGSESLAEAISSELPKKVRGSVRQLLKGGKGEMKSSIRLNPRIMLQLANMGQSNSHPEDPASCTSLTTLITQIYEVQQAKLSVTQSVNESVLPGTSGASEKTLHLASLDDRRWHSKEKSSHLASLDDRNHAIAMKEFLPEENQRRRIKLNKMEPSRKGHSKLGSTLERDSMLQLDQENTLEEEDQNYQFFKTIKGKHKKLTKHMSTLYNEKERAYEPSGNRASQQHPSAHANKNKLSEPFSTFFKAKHQKNRRHFSQENSPEKDEEHGMGRELKEKRLFTHLTQLFQISRRNEGEKKGLNVRDTSKTVLSLEEISYSTYFYSLMVNIRLKNQGCYHTIKGQLCQISGFIGDEERGMKESLKTLLINHRRCLASRAICPHLETLLSHIKGVDT